MKSIGTIKQLQIQRFGIKRGEKSSLVYDPDALEIVPRLLLTPTGVLGIAEDDTTFVDVHNTLHPTTHNHGKGNDISLNFTSHYATMRQEYGDHIYDGVAGENILIETDQTYPLANLGSRLIIRNVQTQALLYLTKPSVAEPCLEFSIFVLHPEDVPPSADIKRALQFLSQGRRGFYVRQPEISAAQHAIHCGDEVFLDENGYEDSM